MGLQDAGVQDATIIALGGLAATAAAPWLAGVVQRSSDRQRLQLERADRDLDERRELLDRSAETLWTYIQAVGNVVARAAFTEQWDKETFDQALDPMLAAKDEAYSTNRRLVIRLGRTSPVVTAYGRGLKLCDERVAVVAQGVRPEGPADPLPTRMSLLSEDEQHKRDRWSAYEAFLDAATELVGSPPSS